MRIDRLAAMRLFVRIVETGSFGKAAKSMSMSSSNATERIAKLEETLNIRLLARTTRAVAPTPAGSRYFEACRRLLGELDDVEASLSESRDALAGRVRISANSSVARSILIPHLPEWFEQHPKIHVELVMSDRRSDFVRDGIDFAVRIGGLEDQDLVLRPLGQPRRINVASPDYLSRMGLPRTPKDLSRHRLIDFLLPHPGDRLEWEFEEGGGTSAWNPPAIAAVGDAHARVELAIAGMGIVQTLCFIAAPALRDKRLVRILPRWESAAPQVSILYPRDPNLPARTHATMDAFSTWIKDAIQASK
jgi:LysR family transcriptional regulator, regulator for bpeEF and oprC